MGVVGRPHGIKGEISVDWQGAQQPRNGEYIYLQAGGSDPKPWRITSSRMHKGRLLLLLEHVTNRTKADSLKGMTVLMSREAVSPLEEDEAFAQDLPGCQVFLADGSSLGRLEYVDFPAGQMIWAIIDQDGNEILFPAEPRFIKTLDMAGRKVIIVPPEGLLDIYRA